MRNSLVNGIFDQKYLPKLVVVVPDADILRFIEQRNDTSSYTWGKMLHWLMSEFAKIVKDYKDLLPVKAKQPGEPHFVWIEAPYHKTFKNNQLREKFNSCVKNMASLQENISVLSLKKIWDPNDTSYFIADSHRFMTRGHRKYWEAVDRTVCYCDTTIMVKKKMKSLQPQKPPNRTKEVQSHRSFDYRNKQRDKSSYSKRFNDRYHWKANVTRDISKQHLRTVLF